MKPDPLAVAINMTPDRALWPNTRAHTRTKHPYKVDLKNAAAIGAINALKGRSWGWNGPILLTVEVYWPKGQRRLDFDNCVGALKAAQDGIFDKLDCNDRQIVGIHLTQDWDRIDGTGYMVYTIEAVDALEEAA